MSGINYKFNTWRESGEKAEGWSPMAYKLVNKNVLSDSMNGFRIGNIIFLHYVKGLTASEIRKSSAGKGIPTNLIKSVLKGFPSKNRASVESVEAYDIAMYMVENEPEVMEQMYKVTIIK